MPAIMLTLDLLLLSPPWTIKFQGALTLSTFLAFAYCKFFFSEILLHSRHCQNQPWPLQPPRSVHENAKYNR